MRVLHLTWEYPPLMYGGLGRHVHALAQAQAALGHDVVVITQAPSGDPTIPTAVPVPDPHGGGVRVLRTSPPAPGSDAVDLLAQVADMEQAFIDGGSRLIADWTPDVLHAHDWMVTHAAVALRQQTGRPLVATIHATEAGRHRGWVTSALSTQIHSMEWWLANTADAVITCSTAMSGEVTDLFGECHPNVVPNGITPSEWHPKRVAVDRMRAANAGAAPLIAYTGRVEWEKGVQVLLDAAALLRPDHPDLRVLVAGRGTYLDQVRAHASDLGIDDAVRFLGWVSEEDLRAVVAVADVAVAPSLYEPFGLVALEAAAIGTPLVVARTGGLAELARDGELALTFTPGDAVDLAAVLRADLRAPTAARDRARHAAALVARDYSWTAVASATTSTYARAITEAHAASASPRSSAAALIETRHRIQAPLFAAPPGRLLAHAR